MKKLTITLSLIMIVILSFGQKKNKAESMVQNTDLDVKTIGLAMKYGDVTTAITNLYDIIAIEGETSTYMDSLAYIYFSTKQYGSCSLVCQEILKNDETKANILEMQAVSLKFLGDPIGSIAAYEKLLPVTNNIFHAYHLAELQYSIKRLAEAYMTIQKAELLQSTENDLLSFPVSDKETQQVHILAAVYNLKGLISYELDEKNTETTKQCFIKALEIQPDFILAQNNLGIFSNTDQDAIDAENIEKEE